jgi:peptidoglycan lytic transglycosylase
MKRRRQAITWLLLLLAAGAAGALWRQWRAESQFAPQIQAAAKRYGVDPLLVRAVVWRESRFKAAARGSRGEIGLMQVQEIAAREWADKERLVSFEHESCLDPATNTLAGTFYLGKLLKRYAATDDPVPYALADYNAGRSNVLKWNKGAAATNSSAFTERVGFVSTRRYIKSVTRRYRWYRFLARLGCP